MQQYYCAVRNSRTSVNHIGVRIYIVLCEIRAGAQKLRVVCEFRASV